mgnify:CR=1 FL=1
MSIKIAIIGAGSVTFARTLIKDVLSVPELADTSLALMDVNEKYLDLIYQLVRRDIQENRLPARVTATTNRREAVEGADYVVNTTRIGGLEAFQLDIDIPLKYGIDQCVGDTLCAGGIMYGQRNIPQILAFCKDIRASAKPNVLFLNYANPNAINTWVANKYGKVRTIGLCHGVQGGHQQIAEVIELLINEGKDPTDPGYKKLTTKDVDIICAGINHQTWYIQVRYDGQDWTGRLLEGFEKHPRFSRVQRPPVGIRALVSQAPRGDQPLDRPVAVDQRRDGGLPARLPRRARLVRHRGPQDAAGTGERLQLRHPFPRARLMDHRSPRNRPGLPGPL